MPPCCRAHALVVDGNRQFHPALRVGPREDTRLPKLLLVNLWDVLAGVTLEAAEQAFTDCFAEMCDDFRVEVYRRMFDVEVDGDLVPDDITIPMVLETLQSKGKNGWLLDGFPRSIVQAQKLWEALQAENVKLDYVIEILLPREVAKNRIMGRRLCKNDNNHPNNIFIDAIKPNGDKCRVCGGELSARADDQDEGAIGKRHDIYYDTKTGTMAAAAFLISDAIFLGRSFVYASSRGFK